MGVALTRAGLSGSRSGPVSFMLGEASGRVLCGGLGVQIGSQEKDRGQRQSAVSSVLEV